MALLEPLYRVSEICAYEGIENVVICPGSRSAALTLAFTRNKKFRTRVITDERSAAFVALGLAQASGKATVLICTSGTAALNFSPAVAEAYFQGIPLLVLTADRPPEWINQHDGQTIFQQNIYGKHIVKAYDLPADHTHPDAVWMIERQTNEALAFTRQGPVHINVPIREPFYPEKGEIYDGAFRSVSYLTGIRVLDENTWKELIEIWDRAANILIAVGQNHDDLDTPLETLSKDPRVSVLADVISNIGIKGKISTHDIFLGKTGGLTPPDLVITCGKSFISKPFKQFFRKNKPAVHWHVEDKTELTDPLQSITAKITVPTAYFFRELSGRSEDRARDIQREEEAGPSSKNSGKTGDIQRDTARELSGRNSGLADDISGGKEISAGNFGYTGEISRKEEWEKRGAGAKIYLADFLKECPFGELKATELIFQHLRPGDVLHLGNSMPVRYANLLGALLPEGVKVFSNRGTSGIEGVVSTAVGQALGSSGRVHCVVGDVSFFYDSNALFAVRPQTHAETSQETRLERRPGTGEEIRPQARPEASSEACPDNLRIYLIQNGGGNIFRIIDGPGKQAELESCFITDPGRTAEGLCREAGYRYTAVRSEEDLRAALKSKEDGAANDGPALFEIYVDGVQDSGLFQQLKAGFTS